MAMIKCRECEQSISSEAACCPHCGCLSAERAQGKKSRNTILWTLFIIGASLIVLYATFASLGLV